MDYIQQAIDKAREERQGNIGKKSNVESTGNVKADSGAIVDEGVPSINYTTTRQVKLSGAVLRRNHIMAGFQHEKEAEVYRQLRTQVLQKVRANNWKTLAVTSPNESAGKTTTAVNLAISLSKEANQTVLLVDLDLGNPSIHKVLGFDVEGGLVDHLNDEKNIVELLVNPGLERLVILPSNQDERYSSEILSTPKMQSLLKDLTSRYESRIIIFDIPSLLVNDDALIFTPYLDATLLVVEDGVTTSQELEQSLQMLQGTNILGTVLNKAAHL
ncbi:CpsD/CapB family tyrosine-protein kinase [Oceanicoccus sp. KOV_DT_Chl]|uniref:CpsD/CapB family tyrosine-protein kinase n=1 Tax=Oceanicoccus sp. KOV_DT_Chl TaxID=1904639 RepID=UPI00190F0346|nr:CpsD/CapB family tyrosine-protein kinase [Oceanicoccus sp. KOV_DT_Chl]